jgi:hypothetical protein
VEAGAWAPDAVPFLCSLERVERLAKGLVSTRPDSCPYPKSQGKDNMALVQKNPQGGDYVMQIKYPQGEYGTEGGAQFYQRLKSMYG